MNKKWIGFFIFLKIFSNSYEDRVARLCQKNEEVKKNFFKVFNQYSLNLKNHTNGFTLEDSSDKTFQLKERPSFRHKDYSIAQDSNLTKFSKMLAVSRKSFLTFLGKTGPSLYFLIQEKK